MAPDIPSFNPRPLTQPAPTPQVTPGNVQNQKRGGRGGKMRKRRRRRPDGSFEEIEEWVEDDEGTGELDPDSFKGDAESSSLDSFMEEALPWAAADQAEAEAEAEHAAAAALAVQADLEAPPELQAADASWGLMSPEAIAARRTATPTEPADPAPSQPAASTLAPPAPPHYQPPPPPQGRGTGGLRLPAPRGTGELGPLPPLPPRRTTGPLQPQAAKPGSSPFLQGSWEYQVLDGRTGGPVGAIIELTFLEARLVPVRRKQQADATGWIRGQGLPIGKYQLTLHAPGYHALAEVRFLRADAPDRTTYRLMPV